MVDQRQSLTSNEDAIGFLSVSVDHHPMMFVGTQRSGEGDDGIALVDGGNDLLEIEVVPLADTDAVGTETADEWLDVQSVLVIRIALLEKRLQ